MKIRQDFVTNSSSVSYIVTFCPSLYETMDESFWGGRRKEKSIKLSRIEKLIIDDITESGSNVYWEGVNLYVKKYDFDTDQAITDKYSEHEGKEIDFKRLSNDELWNYIKGQYLAMGDLGRIYGFGVTQVETF